jgi:dynein heavy chain
VKQFGDRNAIAKGWTVYRDIEAAVKEMDVSLPLVSQLASQAMRQRHWDTLADVCHVPQLDPNDPQFSLDSLLSLQLHTHGNDVEDVVLTADRDLRVERQLGVIDEAWKVHELEFLQHKDTEMFVLKVRDETIEDLETHQMDLQGLQGSEFFQRKVNEWQDKLGTVEEVIREWLTVTKQWANLEVVFLTSEDIKESLPEDTKRFDQINKDFEELMKSAQDTPNVVEACTKDARKETLKEMNRMLDQCQRSLNEYLDMKKKKFPRFYFVSNVDLLDILSNGANPPRIMKHLGSCFDAIETIQFAPAADEEAVQNTGLAMLAKDGEIIEFKTPFHIAGPVEDWLNDFTYKMQDSLRLECERAVEGAVNWENELPRHSEWLNDLPGQVALVGTQIFWTEETHHALDDFEQGTDDAVKKYLQLCNDRLYALIGRVMEKLSRGDRIKIITLITLDVHARDVVQTLIDQKAEGPGSFLWAQQLRFAWDPYQKDIDIAITDFRTKYSYEWVGNQPRLVITPLTDRCYITLTMALRLMLGGAPAGPAGTGKTETTKDLSRAIGVPIYVFNCSDQMTYQTVANIFKGLSQTGAWGCFDEFNRIAIEVLSVIATQVKQVLDATKLYAKPENRPEEYQHLPRGQPPSVVGEFELQGDIIKLIPTVGMFITMNPGYAGRTELPENLKALFRSCAMIRPDLEPICENMLLAEGFKNARPLAVKFVTLYALSSELLSPQVHYDWGLRAVKAVLRVAGGLKRAEPQTNEDAVLMRALRDFNTPKMPLPDIPIFLRLVQDLFPSHFGLAPTFDDVVEKGAIQAAKRAGLQFDKIFIAKVVQFQELLNVRHSVMILGPGGCGKTTIWKTLAGHHNLNAPANKLPLKYDVVNPKAVTSNELYGYMTLGNDWKDGCLSIIMRGMSKNNRDLGYHEYQKHKWVVLDDDIDSVWIESMNTVMDDNKVLTLVSNERVPLTDAMRMVFEINSLRNATPATVSRAGILYVNEGDVGWRPMVESWINTRENVNEKAHLPALFERYVEELHDRVRRGFKTATPLRIINQVASICRLLEALLPQLPVDPNPEQVEHSFVIALMWAFGGALVVEAGEGKNHRRNFHELFVEMVSSAVKFPREVEGDEKPVCFDFFYQPNKSNSKGSVGDIVHWSEVVEAYVPVPIGLDPGQVTFTQLTVPTVDTTRLTTLMEHLVKNQHPVMFVGTAGTGKTTIVKEFLKTLDSDAFQSKTITMNFFTDSAALQREVDAGIDKRSGKTYGPPAGKQMIYYVDDMNLPYIETYGTQNSLSLLRQMMDHGQYYDRSDLSLRKEMVDCQYVASMNPTAGSFVITERLQRFFTTFASLMPSDSDLKLIYGSILRGHLANFTDSVSGLCGLLVDTTIALHKEISKKFLPSATTFVYNWNMRELSNVFQGLTLAKADFFPKPINLLRLWAHECTRVFHDRMPLQSDVERFNELLLKTSTKAFKELLPVEQVFEEPLNFTKFAAQPSGTPSYLPLPVGDTGMEILSRTLGNKLVEHNEGKVVMNLVLFEQAMEHVCRIARIISNPAGNAMLVGVGGSGKQSLTRLAAFICEYEVVQLQVSAKFTENDFREALQVMFQQAGGKGVPTVFIMTDTQIVNEKFLVYLNDILSSGWVTGLFERDILDEVFASLRNEAKSSGVSIDSFDAMLDFFISRIRANLHVVLCFSPVGDSFRVRARRFPGLINCTSNDFFHPWLRDALVSVAESNIQDIEAFGTPEVARAVAEHMADAHVAVTDMSKDYAKSQGRHNHVTPKSFLELIGFYRFLLGEKLQQSQHNIERLDDGLSKLMKTGQDVAELKKDLEFKLEKVGDEVAKTNVLLEEIKEQSEDAAEQEQGANVVREAAEKAKASAEAIQREADVELAEAMPALEAAKQALQGLPLKAIQVMKSYASPPAAIMRVCVPLLMMLAGEFNAKNHSWDNAKKMMANPKEFLDRCIAFAQEDAKVMSDKLVNSLKPIYDDPDFTVEKMTKTSDAAGALTLFVRATYHFNRVWVRVEPLMLNLEESNRSKAEAIGQLNAAEAQLVDVRAKLAALNDKLEAATAVKKQVEDEAEACQAKLGLAERLVNGLASEKERWAIEVQKLKDAENKLVGDVLIGSAFVSYLGGFDFQYRNALWKDLWLPDIIAKAIPVSEDVDPLWLLTSEARVAAMQNEGLPADRISTENGAITVASKRWPLMIDPQLQAIKWLRTRFDPPVVAKTGEEAEEEAAAAAAAAEGDGIIDPEEEAEGEAAAAAKAAATTTLVVLQLTQSTWQRKMKNAIQNGHTVIIENCQEDLDATLDPVLSRSVVQKGKSFFLNFAGDEVEYHKDFKLYLQTKLSNPHYKPEVQAQCTLVNFIATEEGLKDQLLARVVQAEKAELEEQKQELAAAFNRYKVQLIELEDNLLSRLSAAEGDIISNVALIEGLEATKKAATEIQAAVVLGKETEIKINIARQVYVPVAEEGAMLYFMICQLNNIDHMYQYSLDSFVMYFYKAIKESPTPEDTHARVQALKTTLRLTIFRWVSRGLFERHKLILMAQLTFQLMARKKLGDDLEWSPLLFQFLLRGGRKANEDKPSSLDWLPDAAWGTLQFLANLEGAGFEKLPADLDEAPARFKEWFNHISPETEKLPLDWAGLDKEPFKKLMVLKCMRPDRLNVALTNFINATLPAGRDFVSCDSTLSSMQVLDFTLKDSMPTTPIYFILSPGADVVSDLDRLAVKFGKLKGESYHNISMGQGQDKKAMEALELGNRQGHWVILNNVHLMPRWLTELEKKMDIFSLQGGHDEFRVFLTSEAAKSIPIGILSRSIKLTNEPPAGLKANLQRAFASFSAEMINDMDSRMRAILFGLCHFHAILIERKKFGPSGFNMMYPFSLGDLRDSSECLANYMENAGTKIPWEDLRYIFGQIMYGGHIVNDFDRLLVVVYLEHFMKDELLDEMELFPFNKDEDATFMSPSPTTYERYLEHIDEKVKGDTPIAFGLHPNAEIGFRTAQSEVLFRTLMDLQPRESGGADEAATSPVEVARVVLSELLDMYGESVYDLEDVGNSMEGERGPFQNVLILELEQMNFLLIEMKRSLAELRLGIDGVLTMTDAMEELRDALFLDRIPTSWSHRSWPSMRSLSGWRSDLSKRLTQLNEWKDSPGSIPMVTWLSGLINPQSFLTAIRQQSAQATKQELDKLVIQTEVTKRMREEITDPSRDGGAFVDGLFMQGARWDFAGGFVDKAKPREMVCIMPVLNCKAVTEDKLETKNIYDCPVYKTEQRGPTYVFSAQLKTKSPSARWIMAGVALIMDATSV